jgi:CheY-like chemotaxis protein
MTIGTDPDMQLKNRRAAIKVLHIEDDPAVARSVARVLNLAGMEVANAATREEAIDQVEVCGFFPDVLLTDFHLGEGLTSEMVVAELAVRLKFKPPTILLSGSAGYHPGSLRFADRVLSKPVDTAALLRAISDLHGMK